MYMHANQDKDDGDREEWWRPPSVVVGVSSHSKILFELAVLNLEFLFEKKNFLKLETSSRCSHLRATSARNSSLSR